jgi:cation diffusion facilitator family transporter
MDSCCADKALALQALHGRQVATLRLVLALNAAMFLVEFVAGLLSGSVALLSDSLDMLGDALVYGVSLYAVGRGDLWKARAAVGKAMMMAFFGLFVLAQIIYKLTVPSVPAFEAMTAIGLLALLTNTACFALLCRHRSEDINLSSAWLCSRNDVAANLGVLIAAAAVWITGSFWPDILVGALICALFLRSAVGVGRQAHSQLRNRAIEHAEA